MSGGEPTIFPDLPDFCFRIKELGFALKLDTNGSNPDMLALLLNGGLVDYIAMDIKAAPHAYASGLVPGFAGGSRELEKRLLESIKLLAASKIPCEFRTTCAAPFISLHSMEEIARCLAELAPGIPLWLQKVNWENAMQPDYPGAGEEEKLEILRECALAHIGHCEIR